MRSTSRCSPRSPRRPSRCGWRPARPRWWSPTQTRPASSGRRPARRRWSSPAARRRRGSCPSGTCWPRTPGTSRRRPRSVGGDGPLVLLFTSGTTGTPKGVRCRSGRWLLPGLPGVRPGRLGRRRVLERGGPGLGLRAVLRDPRAAGGRPPQPAAARRLLRGAHLAVMEQFGVTNFAAAPTVYRALRATRRRCRGAARCVGRPLPGEPLTPEVNSWAPERLGVPVRDHYGQTEHGMCIVNGCRPRGAQVRPARWAGRARLVGRRPATRTSRRAPAGQVGRVAIDSPTVRCMGSAATRCPRQDGGAVHRRRPVVPHRRRRRVDDDGFFYFSSRDDDVIIMAGYRIGPFEVESVLVTHPRVAESAVIGVPDEVRGEVSRPTSSSRRRQRRRGPRGRAAAAGQDALRRARLPAHGALRRRAAQDAQRQDPALRPAPATPHRTRRHLSTDGGRVRQPVLQRAAHDPALGRRGPSTGTPRPCDPRRVTRRTTTDVGSWLGQGCAARETAHGQGSFASARQRQRPAVQPGQPAVDEQVLDDGRGDLGGGGGAADVAGEDARRRWSSLDGALDGLASSGRPKWSSIRAALPIAPMGLADALAGDVGRGAVDGLEHAGEAALGVEVGAGGQAEAAGQRAAEVGEDVGVEVGGDDDRRGPRGAGRTCAAIASTSTLSVSTSG